jgi:diguanylate cyclase (GGDEF)-like protein
MDEGIALETLTTIARRAARTTDIDHLAGEILDALLAASGARQGAVFIQDPDQGRLELVATAGYGAEQAEALREATTAANHPLVETAQRRQAAFHRPDGDLVAADLPLVVARGGVEIALGVLTLSWAAPHDVSEGERRLLLVAADLLATAIDRSRLLSLVQERAEWVERLAHTDPLTGLANARTFARILQLEVARAGRQGGEVSVAIFDVDDFSRTNDVSGAQVGDEILRAVAATLAGSVRLVDTVARYGGDEFVLVAPGSAGAAVARRVMDEIAALPPVHGQRISVSAGVARFPADGTTAEALMAAAEEALAEARRRGRGQLVAAAPTAEA